MAIIYETLIYRIDLIPKLFYSSGSLEKLARDAIHQFCNAFGNC